MTHPMPVPVALAQLRAALAGGAPFEPGAQIGPGPTGGSRAEDVVAIVQTSGSLAAPKRVALTRECLTASATATLARLGGPGNWLACLPAEHVAGLQVLVRAELSGASVHATDLTSSFTAAGFVAAASAMPAGRRYTSLVPTQLHRLLAAGNDAGAALASFDAVLVGGAALDPALARRAAETGARIVRTYGSSETSGGCVYDGRPLDGVEVSVTADGRIVIAGPTLAAGYLASDGTLLPDDGALPGAQPVPDGAARPGFAQIADRRAFITSDIGQLDADGVLTVLGRADAIIVTGGEKVDPAPVEALLRHLPGVREAVVVGVPHPEWGQEVVALLELDAGLREPSLGEVRAVIGDQLGRPSAPRRILVVPAIPRAALDKVDRAACRSLAASLERDRPH